LCLIAIEVPKNSPSVLSKLPKKQNKAQNVGKGVAIHCIL
jgi:hypothetical protein